MPDGRPTQPGNAEPFCVGRAGTVGARVTLFRVAGCRGRSFKLRKVATYRGRFGAKRMQVAMRRPRRVGFYIGRFAFSGTHFLRASVDPNPMLLVALRDHVEFVPRSGFPGCPGYRP